MTSILFPEQIVFPVICIWRKGHRHLLRTRKTLDALTDTTTAGVHNGMFSNLIVIGANGWSIKVLKAHTTGSIGPLFGLDVFLDRRIRVALETAGNPFITSFQEAKDLAVKCLHHDANSMVAGDQWMKNILHSKSLSELFALIDDPTSAFKRQLKAPND